MGKTRSPYCCCWAVLFSASLIVFLIGCRQQKSTPPETETPPPPGKLTAEIRLSTTELQPGENYTISYLLHNQTDRSVTVSRIVANQKIILPGTAGWRQSTIAPGQTAKVAEVTQQAESEGTQNLSATFSTDAGAVDAPSVRVTVKKGTAAAPAGGIHARITAAPNPARVGEAVTVNYELVDSTDEDVLVTSIQIDSLYPLQVGNPAWLTGLVASRSSRVVARRTITPKEPGSYQLTGMFTTNRGSFTAAPVELKVIAPEPETDTGHVTAAIVITPNPCPIGSSYQLDYTITNTTRRAVTVNSIATDLGRIDASSADWLTGNAPAGKTTTIARIRGEGNAATSRRKTAVFATDQGEITAPAVVLVIE